MASDGRCAAGSEMGDGSSCAVGGGFGGAGGGSAGRGRAASAAAEGGSGAGGGGGEGGEERGVELACNVAALQRQLVEVRAELAGLAQVGARARLTMARLAMA